MSILKNAFWVTMATFAGRGAVVLAGILISNQFGASAFAAFTFAHVTATAVSNVALAGMMNGMPRFFAQLTVDADALPRVVLAILLSALGLICAALVIMITPSSVLGMPIHTTKAALITLLLVIGSNNLFIGATNGLEKFSKVACSTLLLGASLLVGTFLCILYDLQWLVIWVYAFSCALSIMVLVPEIFATIKTLYVKSAKLFDSQELGYLMGFAAPMLMSTLLINSGPWLAGRSLLGEQNGPAQFAIYAMGLQWFGLASMASVVLGKSVLPRLTKNFYFKNKKDHNEAVKVGTILSFFGALLILFFTILFNDWVVMIYGDDFKGSGRCLIIFVASAVVASPVTILSSAMIAAGRYFLIFIIVLIWWLTLIFCIYVFDFFSNTAEGVISAVFVSYLVYLLASIFFALKIKAV